MSDSRERITGVCGHDCQNDASEYADEYLEEYNHDFYDDTPLRMQRELAALAWVYRDDLTSEEVTSEYEEDNFSHGTIRQAIDMYEHHLNEKDLLNTSQKVNTDYDGFDDQGFSAEWEDWKAWADSNDRKGFDTVENPYHYCSSPSGIETIQIAEWESFNIGNAVKYTLRHTKKNGKEDLEKAIWYLKREIERVYGDDNDRT